MIKIMMYVNSPQLHKMIAYLNYRKLEPSITKGYFDTNSGKFTEERHGPDSRLEIEVSLKEMTDLIKEAPDRMFTLLDPIKSAR